MDTITSFAAKQTAKSSAHNFRAETPLLLAYSLTPKQPIVKLPYVIDSLKDAIFGICLDTLIICKDQFPSYWRSANDIAEASAICNIPAKLPSIDEFEELAGGLRYFNRTVKILQDCGIDVDFLDENADYWTSECDSSGLAVAYNMQRRQECCYNPETYRGCYLRLIWSFE